MNERSIFMAALEHDTPDDLSTYLDEVCADNPALRKRVEALLRSHEQAGEFLRMPAPERLAEQLAQAERQSDTQSVAQPLTVEQPVLTVGPYKLIQQIGEGGMGEVWLAQQSEPVKRTVALTNCLRGARHSHARSWKRPGCWRCSGRSASRSPRGRAPS